MSGINDQKKLTKGKGFKLIKNLENAIRTVASPLTTTRNIASNSLVNLFNRKNRKKGGKA